MLGTVFKALSLMGYVIVLNVDQLSYQVVDSLIWMGISGIINAYRKKQLKLRPITYLSGSQGSINQLPTGYIWSPHLVPKPKGAGLAFLFRA
jgi:sterol 3beta-glucosyltransferase